MEDIKHGPLSRFQDRRKIERNLTRTLDERGLVPSSARRSSRASRHSSGLPVAHRIPDLRLGPFLGAAAICTHAQLLPFFGLLSFICCCQSRKVRQSVRLDVSLLTLKICFAEQLNVFAPQNTLSDSEAPTAAAPQIYISNKSQRHGNIFC